MARNRARNFVPRQKSARLTQWIGPAIQSYVGVAAGGATIIASLAFEAPQTIVRTRGMVSVKPSVFTADAIIRGAFGIGIVSQEAFTAGVASVPEPFSDADWGGWFVWRSFAYVYEFHTAASTLRGSWEFEVDSMAMRRVSPNEVMVVVAESQGGPAFEVFDGTRHLVKLA